MSGLVACAARRESTEAAAARMAARLSRMDYTAAFGDPPEPGVAVGLAVPRSQPASATAVSRSPGPDDVSLWLVGRASIRSAGQPRVAHATADALREAYLAGGIDAVTACGGAFLVCVWDGRTRTLQFINDRYGLRPHYWSQTPDGLAFAPLLAPVVAALGPAAALDEVGLAQYVRFQQFIGDRTWFSTVRLLPNASVLSWSAEDQTVRLRRYWDWSDIRSLPSASVVEAADEANSLFDRAVRECASGRRAGVYLSGGLDSRQILGCLDHQQGIPAVTYGSRDCVEVHLARRAARVAGADLHWVSMDDGRWVLDHLPHHLALTEGLHSWIHSHGMHTLVLARQLMDVVLSGFAGGTVIARACRSDVAYDAAQPHRYTQTEPAFFEKVIGGFVNRFTWPGLDEAEAWSLLRPVGRQHWLGLAYESFGEELARTAHWPRDRRFEHFFYEQLDRRLIMQAIVFTRSAVEVECPFLDYDFIEHRYGLPWQVRCHPRFREHMLTRRMPALARIPYNRTGMPPHTSRLVRGWGLASLRGRQVLERRRLVAPRAEQYADYSTWVRTDLRPWAEWLLFDPRTTGRGLFDPTAVRSLWERQLGGHELMLGKLAPIMETEMALRYLVDGDDPQDLVPEHLRQRQPRRP